MKLFFKILIISIIISFFPLLSYDFFWHLKTGEFIAKNGIPREDPFSYNSRGEWINHAWFYDLLIYFLYKIGDFSLLFFFKYLTVFLIAYFLFKICQEKKFSPFFIISIILWALSLSRHRLDIRPDGLGHLFFLLLLFSFQKRKYIVSLIILFFWVNFHASFIFGSILSFFYFILEFIKEKKLKILFYSALSFILPLANPYLYKAFIAPIKLIFEVKNLNLINPEWLFPPFLPFLSFYLSIPYVLFVFFNDTKKINKILFFPILFLSLTSLRFVGYFAISVPFFIEIEKKYYKYIFTSIGLLSLIFSFFYFSPPGIGIDRIKIPVEEVNFLKFINAEENIFCSPGYGGYLIYSFYPDKKVFWDGRNELYLNILKEFELALKSKESWKEFQEKYKIGYAIIKYQGMHKFKIGNEFKFLPFSYLFFSKDEWDLIFWDDSAMVFMKKNLKNLKSYKFNPEVLDYLIYLISIGEINSDELKEELIFKLKQNPNCKRAKILLEKLKSNNL